MGQTLVGDGMKIDYLHIKVQDYSVPSLEDLDYMVNSCISSQPNT